jgi:hypothetical protein
MRRGRIYPPQADEPYMQSLSRFALLEPRIETTLQIVSILICWAILLSLFDQGSVDEFVNDA